VWLPANQVTFPGRVAAIRLHSIGMPELVASSLAEYEQMAEALVRGHHGEAHAQSRDCPIFSMQRDLPAVWNLLTVRCGSGSKRVCRLRAFLSQAKWGVVALFADDEPFLDEAFNEYEFFLVFQVARKIAYDIGRGFQREIQSLAEQD
jgi:hypothetical protein